MSRKIIFKPSARLEFDEAIAWYERQLPGLGAKLEAEANSVLERIKENPERFPRVTANVRKARLKKFRFYSIYFTETPDWIGVVAVFHGKRNPQELWPRLK